MQVRNTVNPVRRVVNFLQEMARKSPRRESGELQCTKISECYCRATSQELKTNVEEGSARIAEVDVQDPGGRKAILVELKPVIKVSQESREEAKLWMTKVPLRSTLRALRSPWPCCPRERCIWEQFPTEPRRLCHPQGCHEFGKGLGQRPFHVVVLPVNR